MGFLHRRILLPAFETLYHRRRTFRYLAELERSQWLTRAELEQRQLESLRSLLTHAQAHCAYYREIWQERGCDPRKLDSLRAFRTWPTVDRATILANRARMRADIPGMRLISKATGGSSGEPLRFDLNTDSNDRRCAASHRGYGWAGAEPGTKQVYLWGVALGEMKRLSRIKDWLYHGLYRRTILNSFVLSEENIPEYFARYNRVRPEVLVAYTNPLYEFSRGLDERGWKPRPPRAIIVGAEKLHPFQRDLIERVFGAPVFETYGSREFMLMAAECDRHEGLHLTHEHLLVEVLNDDGTPTAEGEEGNVVVTDLFNYGMPFIRYLNGDRAIAGWKTCSCGRGLPLMAPPLGRVLDVLHTPDGRRVPGELFPHLLKDYASIKRFQVIQDSPEHVELNVVTGPDWNEAEKRSIADVVGETLGPRVRLEIRRVDAIPLTATGKLRVVVNRCAEAETPAAAEAHSRC